MVRAALWWRAHVAESPLRMDLRPRRSRRRDSCRINQATSITSCDWMVRDVRGAFALMSTYIILPNGSTNLSTQIGSVSLNLYRTMAIHIWALRKRAGLVRFLGTGPVRTPKDVIIGWPFIMFAILVIVVSGLVRIATDSGEGRSDGLHERD